MGGVQQKGQYIDPTLNADLIDQTNQYQVYRNSRGDQFEKYTITNIGNPDFANMYDYRIRNSSPFLVNAYSAKPAQNAFGCNARDQYQVVTQRIPIRLSNLTSLSAQDSLNIANKALKGYQQIYASQGPFTIRDNMIGFNRQNNVKVWMNSNFAVNQIEQTPISFSVLSDHQKQSTMVDNIIQIINQRTNRDPQWLSFLAEKQKFGRIGFHQAIQLTENQNFIRFRQLNNSLLYSGANQLLVQNQIHPIQIKANPVQTTLVQSLPVSSTFYSVPQPTAVSTNIIKASTVVENPMRVQQIPVQANLRNKITGGAHHHMYPQVRIQTNPHIGLPVPLQNIQHKMAQSHVVSNNFQSNITSRPNLIKQNLIQPHPQRQVSRPRPISQGKSLNILGSRTYQPPNLSINQNIPPTTQLNPTTKLNQNISIQPPKINNFAGQRPMSNIGIQQNSKSLTPNFNIPNNNPPNISFKDQNQMSYMVNQSRIPQVSANPPQLSMNNQFQSHSQPQSLLANQGTSQYQMRVQQSQIPTQFSQQSQQNLVQFPNQQNQQPQQKTKEQLIELQRFFPNQPNQIQQGQQGGTLQYQQPYNNNKFQQNVQFGQPQQYWQQNQQYNQYQPQLQQGQQIPQGQYMQQAQHSYQIQGQQGQQGQQQQQGQQGQQIKQQQQIQHQVQQLQQKTQQQENNQFQVGDGNKQNSQQIQQPKIQQNRVQTSQQEQIVEYQAQHQNSYHNHEELNHQQHQRSQQYRYQQPNTPQWNKLRTTESNKYQKYAGHEQHDQHSQQNHSSFGYEERHSQQTAYVVGSNIKSTQNNTSSNIRNNVFPPPNQIANLADINENKQKGINFQTIEQSILTSPRDYSNPNFAKSQQDQHQVASNNSEMKQSNSNMYNNQPQIRINEVQEPSDEQAQNKSMNSSQRKKTQHNPSKQTASAHTQVLVSQANYNVQTKSNKNSNNNKVQDEGQNVTQSKKETRVKDSYQFNEMITRQQRHLNELRNANDISITDQKIPIQPLTVNQNNKNQVKEESRTKIRQTNQIINQQIKKIDSIKEQSTFKKAVQQNASKIRLQSSKISIRSSSDLKGIISYKDLRDLLKINRKQV